jgi:rare lipoprotein A
LIRRTWPALLVAALASACSSTPHRPPPAQAGGPQVMFERAYAASPSPRAQPLQPLIAACAPTRKHLDSDYTAGGLYAPGVPDSGPAAPIDVSGVREPVPRAEPRARYGNRSPYSVLGKSYHVLDTAKGYQERGLASWYGAKFNGRATSSGELYDMCLFSAAHKTLPLPSFVRVTNLDNGRSLIVRVNDRGPFHSGRIMDLSYAAAVRLGVDKVGTARVELQTVDADGEPTLAATTAPRPSGGGTELAPRAAVARVDKPAADAVRAEDALRPRSEATIQVGSFGEQANALRLTQRLRDAGIDAVAMDHAEIAGAEVWRVRVGPVRPGDLDGLVERLQQLGLPNPRVLSQ